LRIISIPSYQQDECPDVLSSHDQTQDGGHVTNLEY